VEKKKVQHFGQKKEGVTKMTDYFSPGLPGGFKRAGWKPDWKRLQREKAAHWGGVACHVTPDVGQGSRRFREVSVCFFAR